MPNTVVKLTNAESTWLEAAREDRKLLINIKAHLQRCAFCLLSFGSGLKVQDSRGGFAAFFIGRCPEVAFKSPVTSHAHDTREGIVSHAWYEILRLSPHLFWLGGSPMGRFRPLRMTIRGERMGSYLRDTLHV